MSAVVVDCSISAAWCFADEADALAERVLDLLAEDGEMIVPALWPFEMANVLLVAERRARLGRDMSERLLDTLFGLNIQIDRHSPERAAGPVFALARELDLTVYDAAYLELALSSGLPLATRDRALRRAAEQAGVTLWQG